MSLPYHAQSTFLRLPPFIRRDLRFLSRKPKYYLCGQMSVYTALTHKCPITADHLAKTGLYGSPVFMNLRTTRPILRQLRYAPCGVKGIVTVLGNITLELVAEA